MRLYPVARVMSILCTTVCVVEFFWGIGLLTTPLPIGSGLQLVRFPRLAF
ncbi:MAG: hypothetical protein J7M39_04205 [Anaerolineae bacterium]|nr:hypothetical protein [Anaerolineae bacterium]